MRLELREEMLDGKDDILRLIVDRRKTILSERPTMAAISS